MYPKVSLRRAVISEKLERLEDALQDYEEVLKHEPGNLRAMDARNVSLADAW